MADNERDRTSQTPASPELQDDERAAEHDRVRSSNDRDQELEREGVTSRHNRGYDQAVKGTRTADTGAVDPDSAESDIDRDDMIDE